MRDISLSQLRYFLMAAEHGSMTEAAGALFIAQSAVSSAVARLEDSLGTQLFIRQRAKGLVLTADGLEFLERAQAILDSVEQAVDAISPRTISGRLRAACFYTLAPFYLPGIIDSLLDEHPDLRTDVRELSALDIDGALRSRTIEIALTYDLGLGDAVEREVLATIPLYAAVAHDHPLAGRRAVTLPELASEPMVLLDVPFSREYFTGVFTDRGLYPDVAYRFESFEAVRAMVARGRGFTVLNQLPLHDRTYDGGRIAVLPLVADSSGVDIPGVDIVLAALASTSRLSRRADAFARHCRQAVAPAGSGSLAAGAA